MSAGLIEHRGIVRRLEAGRAVVAMETGGCASCGHGGSCGIGRMAAGREATLLTLPVGPDVAVGDVVSVALPVGRLTLSALLGYLFPACATLFGAWLGDSLAGSDGAAALGAIAGFLGALVVARVAIGLAPVALAPVAQAIPLTSRFPVFSLEQEHD